jgi:hypothetical protein
MKPFPMMPLAGIDNASPEDDRLQVGGVERRNYLRDAINVDISATGRARLRKGLRKVSGQPLACLWQSPLHGDVFAVLGDQWVNVDVSSWTSTPLATIGRGNASHLVLNNLVLVAGADGIFQFDGQGARRFTLDTPPAPLVEAGAGSLVGGAYGVSLGWLRGAMESPLSPMTQCKVGAGGALQVTLPLCLDPAVTGVRLYLTRPDGGELLRGEDYPIGMPTVDIALLPQLGAAPQFQHMEPMPTGQHFGLWRGRLVSARANVLRFSEALAYHVHDPRHGFVQMPQRITFLHPVDGGLWVGQVDHVAFLAGAAPDELQMIRKTGKAPVPGSAVAVDAETAGEASGGGAAVVAWLAENGFVLGTADGGVIEKQAKRLRGIVGSRATSIVFANRLMTAVT